MSAIKDRIAKHRAAIRTLQAEDQNTRTRLRSLGEAAKKGYASLKAEVEADLAANLADLESIQLNTGGLNGLPWEDPRWDSWKPEPDPHSRRIRYGQFRERRSESLLPVAATVPFIGGGRTIVIKSRGEEQAVVAESLLQSLVMRSVLMYPQQSRYTLLDPAGNGMAFPMTRSLPRVSPSSGDVRRDLDVVTREIQRIILTYLDAEVRSFEQIPEEMRINEAFHFVFAADFPNRYDQRAAEELQSIATTGQPAGVYLVMHHNFDHDPPIDMSRYEIRDARVIDVGAAEADVEGLAVDVIFDEAPPAAVQGMLFSRLAAAPPLDGQISWDEVAGIDVDRWWEHASHKLIRAPLGRQGANAPLSLWFGEDEKEGRPCAHGVIGAMTGAGKSTLFHTLITSLAVRYSPEELHFYLIDGKFGVEFQPYQQLPHAAVVSLRTSPELSRSVLADLADEMARRNAVFSSHRVADLAGYRALGQPEGKIARILLVVDEYQQLFDGDKDGDASALLLRISQQGRSAGIHMLLASQRFDTPGMLHRTDTFGNVHLRLAMQISQADIAALTDFGQKGRRLIAATCDRPGRVVVNDRAGDDDSNVAGKVAYLPSKRRDEIIQQLIDLTSQRGLESSAIPDRVVFNGEAQPELLENPRLIDLLDLDHWLTGPELEKMARAAVDDGGFGIQDWLASERPLALSLGQEFNVRGHATAVLRRRPNENVVIVGDRHHERVALLAASLTSAALCEAPGYIRFAISDRSAPRTEWADSLESTAAALGRAGFDAVVEKSDAGGEQLIVTAAAEVERRRLMSEIEQADEPTYLLCLNEPDRIAALHRVSDDFGFSDSELGTVLETILTQGPGLGVHVVASFSGLGVVSSVMGVKSIQNRFAHRIALQMSEDDSFAFVRSSHASKLQPDGERPVAALLFNNHRQDSVRFKPYSLRSQGGGNRDGPARGSLLDQIAHIGRRLERRPK